MDNTGFLLLSLGMSWFDQTRNDGSHMAVYWQPDPVCDVYMAFPQCVSLAVYCLPGLEAGLG